MDYNTQGFNEFLTREQPALLNSQLDPLQFENLTSSISGERGSDTGRSSGEKPYILPTYNPSR